VGGVLANLPARIRRGLCEAEAQVGARGEIGNRPHPGTFRTREGEDNPGALPLDRIASPAPEEVEDGSWNDDGQEQ